jgi:hypothetical protein
VADVQSADPRFLRGLHIRRARLYVLLPQGRSIPFSLIKYRDANLLG